MHTLTERVKSFYFRLRPRRRTATDRAAARTIDRENRQRARQMRAQSGAQHQGTFTSGGPGGVF